MRRPFEITAEAVKDGKTTLINFAVLANDTLEARRVAALGVFLGKVDIEPGSEVTITDIRDVLPHLGDTTPPPQ